MSTTNPYFTTKGIAVEVEGAGKSYRTAAEEIHALKEVSWKIPAGGCVAIMGPSGCGKTTLLNLMGGVDRASSGRILANGTDLTKASERDLEKYRLKQVGFVFQFFNLIPSVTAMENLELPMMVAGMPEARRKERANALLEMVGVREKGIKRPEQLSGGEQQRVAIALALANDPAMILADEPTGNLDSTNTDIITKLLRSLAEDHGKTVVMVSHDPKAVEHFPEIHAMRDGRFV